MTLDKERMQILKMLEEKKITSDEAAELLASLDASKESPVPAAPGKKRPSWLRVRVFSRAGDRVEVNLPVSIIRVAKYFLSEITIEGRTIHIDDLEALIEEAMKAEGKIVEVNSADGDHVEIFVD